MPLWNYFSNKQNKKPWLFCDPVKRSENCKTSTHGGLNSVTAVCRVVSYQSMIACRGLLLNKLSSPPLTCRCLTVAYGSFSPGKSLLSLIKPPNAYFIQPEIDFACCFQGSTVQVLSLKGLKWR